MSERKPILSVTAKDCRWDYLAASSKGGQKANKSHVGVRCTHKESGAVGQSRDTRSQTKNKSIAFVRMVNSLKFKRWAKFSIAEALHSHTSIEKRVDAMLQDIRIELWKDGEWHEEKAVQEAPDH